MPQQVTAHAQNAFIGSHVYRGYELRP